MFTGLIEEIGKIKSVKHIGAGKHIVISAIKILNDLKIDDSVAVNGVCLTVVARNGQIFEVEAVEETISKTTISTIKVGSYVNLERALMPTSRLGGHIVQGHIDCTSKLISIEKQTIGRLVWFSYPEKFSKFLIPQGSICINGVSLTIANVEPNKFMVSIIPHTWENTTFKDLKIGEIVNLEFDIIGKYIEKMLQEHSINNKKTDSILNSFLDQPY